jgi:hypothetical protein
VYRISTTLDAMSISADQLGWTRRNNWLEIVITHIWWLFYVYLSISGGISRKVHRMFSNMAL